MNQNAQAHPKHPVTPELPAASEPDSKAAVLKVQKELNGPKGPEPTRFGDWERKGRCIDF